MTAVLVFDVTPRGQDGPVVIQRTDEKDLTGLLHAIQDHQRAAGWSSDSADPIAFANELLRWEWERRWPKRPRWLSRRLHGDSPRSVHRTP